MLASKLMRREQARLLSSNAHNGRCCLHDSVMRQALEEATSKGKIPQVKALGITNQRETVIVWDKHTGRPLHPAIVWMDNRTAPLCKRMAEEFGAVGAVRSSEVYPNCLSPIQHGQYTVSEVSCLALALEMRL